ncbi:BolA-like protein [Penicillium chermesinum]|uniref:BolA-like protein n=1 Tax=Penicillium chermesinum TaxID=63820 RepID=A0A9W9NRT2_9EURO|nr:BolA-like protein [Penicillium chermesinum]KAJ5224977.1 BolA-like protein [Penicillium chermesinum]KAJ6151705.1 BolA-like protein [Penicillium chermesinum]
MASATPMEDLMRDKIVHAFTPTTLIIRNDSHKHAHHAAMEGSTSKETHFQYATPLPRSMKPDHTNVYISYWLNANVGSVTITSAAFESKMQPARHRMVYALLKEEMAKEGGIHALQLKTKTPAEEQREKEREAQA